MAMETKFSGWYASMYSIVSRSFTDLLFNFTVFSASVVFMAIFNVYQSYLYKVLNLHMMEVAAWAHIYFLIIALIASPIYAFARVQDNVQNFSDFFWYIIVLLFLYSISYLLFYKGIKNKVLHAFTNQKALVNLTLGCSLLHSPFPTVCILHLKIFIHNFIDKTIYYILQANLTRIDSATMQVAANSLALPLMALIYMIHHSHYIKLLYPHLTSLNDFLYDYLDTPSFQLLLWS